MGPKYSMVSIFAKFPLVYCIFFNNMLQLQFLDGCLTRRPEIFITLQSPVGIALCVIFDVYFTRQIY